jgi:hypothetical protein
MLGAAAGPSPAHGKANGGAATNGQAPPLLQEFGADRMEGSPGGDLREHPDVEP